MTPSPNFPQPSPLPHPTSRAAAFKAIAGFESTDYAQQGEHIVWIGDDASVRHPRNYWNPWQAPSKTYSPALLEAGARMALKALHQNKAIKPHGLLLWLIDAPMPFPLSAAASRFDAVRAALQAGSLSSFEATAQKVLGLGSGLTPSGDDFLGGVFFALAHKPCSDWSADLPRLQANIQKACKTATNPISCALLADNIAGQSFGLLHDVLDALESNDSLFIEAAVVALLQLGASSGADTLAGLLLALTLL